MKFLEEGAKTNAKTSQGVSFIELREQVANARAAYDLISATWPSDFPNDCREDFEKALKGWSLSLDLWSIKINSDGYPWPIESGIYDHTPFLNFAGDKLIIKVFSEGSPYTSSIGKHYLPYDDNISILFSIAGASFNSGRDKVLLAIQ
jgi:hypothetical protein